MFGLPGNLKISAGEPIKLSCQVVGETTPQVNCKSGDEQIVAASYAFNRSFGAILRFINIEANYFSFMKIEPILVDYARKNENHRLERPDNNSLKFCIKLKI